MPEPPDTERRLTALEARVEDVAAEASAARQDAIAARHLAAAHDRDFADLGVKVDANRRVINALGVQTAARFDRSTPDSTGSTSASTGWKPRCERASPRPAGASPRCAARLDGAAAGYQHIVELLDTLLRDDQR